MVTARAPIIGEFPNKMSIRDIASNARFINNQGLRDRLQVHVDEAKQRGVRAKKMLVSLDRETIIAERVRECSETVPSMAEWEPVLIKAQKAGKDFEPSEALTQLKKIARKGTIVDLPEETAAFCRIATVLGLVAPVSILPEGKGIQVALYGQSQLDSRMVIVLPANDEQKARMIVGEAPEHVELEPESALEYLVNEAGYRAAYKEPSEIV